MQREALSLHCKNECTHFYKRGSREQSSFVRSRENPRPVGMLVSTYRNGYFLSLGSYNPKHNDREFELEKAEELKREYTKNNLYWNCIDGRIIRHADLDENARSFTDVEKGYYNLVYMGYVNGQNERKPVFMRII